MNELTLTDRIARAAGTTLEVAAAWIAQDSRLVMTNTEAKMRDHFRTNDFAVVAMNERGVISGAEYRTLFR